MIYRSIINCVFSIAILLSFDLALMSVSDFSTAYAKAEVVISSPQNISGNISWDGEADYIIKSVVNIPASMSLNISSGVSIKFMEDGRIEVVGGVLNIGSQQNTTQASTSSRVNILINDIYSTPISIVSGGRVQIYNTDFKSNGLELTQGIFGIFGVESSLKLFNSSMNNFNISGEAVFASEGGVSLNNFTLNTFRAPSFLVASNNAKIDVVESNFTNLKTDNAFNIFNGSIFKFDKSVISSSVLEVGNVNSGTCISGFAGTSLYVSNSNILKCNVGLSFFGQGTFEIHENNIYENNISIQNYSHNLNAVNNWWGNSAGPKIRGDIADGDTSGEGAGGDNTNMGGSLNGYEVGFNYEMKALPFSSVKFGEQKCCSSVIFIPGMQGSRLYKKGLWGIENQLWEPNTNSDTKSLFLDKTGKTLFNNIYTRDVIGKTNFTGPVLSLDIYQGLLNNMNAKKEAGIISDFYAFPYDWRMSPFFIISNGSKIENNILFLKNKIKEMANKSPSGQVIILSHSYGGLIAKAVASSLEKDGDLNKIESLIMVAAPEFGTPQSISSVIYGDNQDILYGLILSKDTVVALAKNMISAYILFPSIKYFSDYNNHSDVIVLDKWSRDFFGIDLVNIDSFNKFNLLIGKIKSLNYNLFNIAIKERGDIDNVSDEVSKKTYSILGVGLPTLSKIKFIKPRCRAVVFCNKNSMPDFDREFSIMGDGVVLANDLISKTGSVFTVDIGLENEEEKVSWDFFMTGGIAHKDIFRSAGIVDVVDAIISRKKQELSNINSFAEITNSKISFIAEISSKPTPFNLLFKTIDFLNIQKVNQQDVNFSVDSRLNESRIVITESYGPIVLKNKINELSGNLALEIPLYNRIINKTEFSSNNSSGIASVLNCQNMNCQNNNIINGAIYGVGIGTGMGQIVIKSGNSESVYNNISITGSTDIIIDHSTTTILIDQNGDGVTDDSMIPIVSTSSESRLLSDELFKIAKDKLLDLIMLNNLGTTSVPVSSTTVFLINKYIDKVNIAERKYNNSSASESLKFINSFYNVMETNMTTLSKLLESYRKEGDLFVSKKFSPLNPKLTFINRRSLEIGDELIAYSQIHKIIFELMEGLN